MSGPEADPNVDAGECHGLSVGSDMGETSMIDYARRGRRNTCADGGSIPPASTIPIAIRIGMVAVGPDQELDRAC